MTLKTGVYTYLNYKVSFREDTSVDTIWFESVQIWVDSDCTEQTIKLVFKL